MAKKKKAPSSNTIALNKKAKHDYFIEEKFEAGMELQGWEVKSCREGKAQLTDSYVLFKDGQAWLLGARIQPLPSASTHFVTEPDRTRRLLLNKREIAKLVAAVNQKGYACVCTAIYWKKHLIKCEIALAKGKASHDKRETLKERDWNRQKQRVMRTEHR
ncbi:SsrA-binding protein SmpB [Microbulbifer elongatus]|uniref:SsrA-binding protein n=1 Tax=Microbulbifer elongatus TaxID=86173 RepID=A0ABT1NXA0_9GAMM|nr:SsrA-binding protein SmpB [Microbulbifer elongatus]MCQ3828522.1 SsrA-binding protein SmpB [Microbulbifer elongatus]